MNKALNRTFKKRVSNPLEHIVQTFAPFRDQIKGFGSGVSTPVMSPTLCRCGVNIKLLNRKQYQERVFKTILVLEKKRCGQTAKGLFL